MSKIGSINKTKEILEKNDFSIKKKYGQNFLVDENVLNRIVNSAKIDSNTFVIEVGPGLGSLTEIIASKAKKVLAYEIDASLIPILKENLSSFNNVEILNLDILKANIESDIEKYFGVNAEVVLIANLPYYITTPIITKLLEETKRIKKYVLMMQKEVAQRIISSPNVKDYSALSIAIQYRSKAYRLFDISRNVFLPKPNVDSTLIALDLYEEMPCQAKNEKVFFELIRAAFVQRRKKLINNLVSYYSAISKEEFEEILSSLGLSLEVRSENLSIKDFVKISDELTKKI